MGETLWTPGPWVTTGDGTTIHAGSEAGESIADAYVIIGEGDAKANASLMASAPDLYEALRWAEAEIDMRCDPRIPSVKQALVAARAALARARGQEVTP